MLPQSEHFIQTLLTHIQQPCIMLASAEIWHIQNPVISNCSLMDIQNPAIFTKIGKPCVTLDIQNPGQTDNPGIFRTLTLRKQINTVYIQIYCISLAYLHSQNIQSTEIFKTWHIFRTISKIYEDPFCKNSYRRSYNYFSKVIYLRSLSGF